MKTKDNSDFKKARSIVVVIILAITIFSLSAYFIDYAVAVKEDELRELFITTKENILESTKDSSIIGSFPGASEYITDNIEGISEEEIAKKLYAVFDNYRSNAYLIKAILKILIFLFAIIVLNSSKFDIRRAKTLGYKKDVLSGKKRIKKILSLPEKWPIKEMAVVAIIGIIGIILVPYLSSKYVNLEIIQENMARKGLNKFNILYVYLYIILINSFVEEVIFRGLGYLELKRYIREDVADQISSVLFAIYHIALINSFFNPIIILVSIALLYIGGRILNRVDKKEETIIPGYIIHALCNFFLNTIAYITIFT